MGMTPAEIKARLFSQYVSAEVRSLLAKHQMSGLELSRQHSKSNNYLAKRLRGEESFTTDDLDEICEILRASTTEIIANAAEAVKARTSRQDDFGLAAKRADERIGKDQLPDFD